MNNLIYFDGHFGLLDEINDTAYCMDDYGNAIKVPFTLPDYYFQDCDEF